MLADVFCLFEKLKSFKFNFGKEAKEKLLFFVIMDVLILNVILSFSQRLYFISNWLSLSKMHKNNVYLVFS